jgi:hypothetical protein
MKKKYLEMKSKLLIFIFLCLSSIDYAQNNVFYVGHSLVNHNMPRMVSEIAKSKGFTGHNYSEQIINGASLKYNWDNSVNGENGVDFKIDYNSNFNTLVITEAIPLDNHLMWNNTPLYGYNFCKMAEDINANTQCYIYETWHCIKSGTPEGCNFDTGSTVDWRLRLDTYLSKWESIADSIRLRGMDNEVFVIPAGQAMAALYDSISEGNITGYSTIDSFFSDNIHPNDLGNYFVACVQFATIFKESPVGASAEIENQYGVLYDIPFSDNVLINKLQQIAWNTVCNYTRSNVNCSNTLEVKEISKFMDQPFYPNPVIDEIYINGTYEHFQISDFTGQILQSGTTHDNKSISVKTLPEGLYFLTIDQRVYKFIKQ